VARTLLPLSQMNQEELISFFNENFDTRVVFLTFSQYDLLSSLEKTNGTIYFITDKRIIYQNAVQFGSIDDLIRDNSNSVTVGNIFKNLKLETKEGYIPVKVGEDKTEQLPYLSTIQSLLDNSKQDKLSGKEGDIITYGALSGVTESLGKREELRQAKPNTFMPGVDPVPSGGFASQNDLPTEAAVARAVSGLHSLIDNKVEKITGKGLSEANFTQAEKNKLSEIEYPLPQADWEQQNPLLSNYIQHKPDNLQTTDNLTQTIAKLPGASTIKYPSEYAVAEELENLQGQLLNDLRNDWTQQDKSKPNALLNQPAVVVRLESSKDAWRIALAPQINDHGITSTPSGLVIGLTGATETDAGVMTASDKKRLNNLPTAAEVQAIVQQAISTIIADAPEELDTLKELADWLAEHGDIGDIASSLATKLDKNAIVSFTEGIGDEAEEKQQVLTNIEIESIDSEKITLAILASNLETKTSTTIHLEIPKVTSEHAGLMSVEDKETISGLIDDVSDIQEDISDIQEDISDIERNGWIVISDVINPDTTSIDWTDKTDPLPKVGDILLSDITKVYAVVNNIMGNMVYITAKSSLAVPSVMTIPDWYIFNSEEAKNLWIADHPNWIKVGDYIIVNGVLFQYKEIPPE
jgi:hypothetical protein